MVLQWELGERKLREVTEQEFIEFGVRRPNLYTRQRNALEEMEGMRDESRSNNHTKSGTHSVRL